MSEAVSFESMTALDHGPDIQGPDFASGNELPVNVDAQLTESRNAVGKNIDNDPLTSLIQANAHVLVKCPWLNNEAVTLSSAVLAYSANVALITEENIHAVASLMMELLNDPLIEEEEAAEDPEPEEGEVEKELTEVEDADQKNILKAQDKLDKKGQEESTKSDEARAPQATIKTTSARMEETAKKVDIESARAKVADVFKGAPEKSTDTDTTVEHSGSSLEAMGLSTPKISPEKSNQKSADQELGEVEKIQPTAVSVAPVKEEIRLERPDSQTDTDLLEDFYVEDIGVETAPLESNFISELEVLPVANELEPVIMETVSKTELVIDSIEEAFIEENSEISDEFVEVYEDALVLNAIEYQIGLNVKPADADELEAAYKTSPEMHLHDTTEIIEQPFYQSTEIIESAETSLIELEESIESANPEVVEIVNNKLDEIIKAASKLEIDNNETLVSEVDVKEELKELFIELFDAVGISYTPESIDALAELTLRWRLADKLEDLKVQEEAQAPQYSVTHEFIKKFLVGLSTIKKAIIHACTIGSSAIRLCNISFSA